MAQSIAPFGINCKQEVIVLLSGVPGESGAIRQEANDHLPPRATVEDKKARQKVVHKFTTSDKSCILLASLKAGGVGLNLIAATHVYLMDAWWNSAVENQAVDRIHVICFPVYLIVSER